MSARDRYRARQGKTPGTTYGYAGMGASSSQVDPTNPTISQSIDDRKTAYESMQDAGMLTPSVSGISLYDKSPVTYETE